MWRCRNNILSSVNSRLRCLSSPVNDDAWDLEILDVDDDDYYVDGSDYYVGDDVNDDAWDALDTLGYDDGHTWLSIVQGE